MQVEYWLQRVYIITVQCLLLDYIPVLSTKRLTDWGHSFSPNTWLHPSTSLGHCTLRTWSTSVARISSGTRICPRPLLPLPLLCLPPGSLTPLTLLLLSGCWPHPSPCPSIVRHCNIVLCSGYIYILAIWWFMKCTFELFQKTGWSLVDLMLHTFPFVRESQDSPGSNLPIQDRFRKKA